MAELLIQAKERADTDFSRAGHIQGRFHRGDVIVVRDDGWNWGSGELHSDNTIIIKVPGLTREELEAILYEPYTVDHGVEYHAHSPELGLLVVGLTRDAAEAELQKRIDNTIRELDKLGYKDVKYTTTVEEVPVVGHVLQRRLKIDLDKLKQKDIDDASDKKAVVLSAVSVKGK